MNRTELMSYKDYHGSIFFDVKEKIFFGKIELIRDLINYEAKDTNNLLRVFAAAVDAYLEDCTILDNKYDNRT